MKFEQGRHATKDASIMCGNGGVWVVLSVVVTMVAVVVVLMK